jgi:hypothetical protein
MKEYLINRSDTPAFPLPNMNTGMTLRDYFAAKALQAILSNPEYVGEDSGLAAQSYAIADAMMKAREA